jgi:hypothetical protein
VPSCEKDMSTILKPVAFHAIVGNAPKIISKVLPASCRQIKLNN